MPVLYSVPDDLDKERAMSSSDLMTVAKEVLTEEGMSAFGELIRKGRRKEANEYLLAGIDNGWQGNILTFEAAAKLYKLLDLSPEQAAAFRQRNLGTLYA